MQHIVFLSATEIINKIETRQVSVEQVCISFLLQIKKHNKVLNAICELRNEDEILTEARNKDKLLKTHNAKGLLFGLPITIKDTFWVNSTLTD